MARKSLLERIEEPVRLVIRMMEAFKKQDVEGMIACYGDDCLLESSLPVPGRGIHTGKEAVWRYWQSLMAHPGQTRFEIEEVFGLGFRAVMRWKYTWVDDHGKPCHVRGVDVFRLRNGLICEEFSYAKVEPPAGQR